MNSINPDPNPVEATVKPSRVICRQANTALRLGLFSWCSLLLCLAVTTVSYRVLKTSQGGPLIIIGICVVLFFSLVAVGTALAAIVMAFKAGRLIRANSALGGMGRARAGAILGSLFLILLLVSLIPGFVPARTTGSKNACISNLRQIDGAKEQWALENKKTTTDTPTFADLIGTDKYIKTMPICPANGTYSLRDMAHKPVCSIPNHTLP